MPRSLLMRTVNALNFAIITRRLGPLMELFDDEAELVIDDGRRRREAFGPWAIRQCFQDELPKARLLLLTEWRDTTGDLVGTFSHVTRRETPVGRLRLKPRGDRIARLECKRTVTFYD